MPPSSPEQAWNRLKAERLLGLMDTLEPTARDWGQAEPEVLRRAIASRYRSLVGVPPSERDTLRAALTRVREHGDVSIPEVIEAVRRQSSGVLSSSSSSGGGAVSP